MTHPISPELCWVRKLAPEVERPTAQAPLHLVEWCVLWVIQADPRLASRRHRTRLRMLIGELDASFHQRRIGDALSRLRDLSMAAVVQTRGFNSEWSIPGDALCEVAFMAVMRAFGRHQAGAEKMDTRRKRFFRIMQCPTSGERHELDDDATSLGD